MNQTKIILTGGGSAGHVTPNLAIIASLQESNLNAEYIGQSRGIEKQLITESGITFHSIPAGKLRRYFDVQNITDIFRVALGFIFSAYLLSRIKPNAVFSKGGFVSCPVVWAAWVLRVPVIIHESDIIPGLANRLSQPFAKKVCFAFKETLQFLPTGKAVHTGLPIRQEIHKGKKEEGMRICKFTSHKPIVLILGGSLGSQELNRIIRDCLPELTKSFQVCHVCGHGNASHLETTDYFQTEYAKKELPHFYAMADIIISRAGATTLFEILSLRKPNILIPLPLAASRGDQLLNAKSFFDSGYSTVIDQKEVTKESLLKELSLTYQNRDKYRAQMSQAHSTDATNNVINVLEEVI